MCINAESWLYGLLRMLEAIGSAGFCFLLITLLHAMKQKTFRLRRRNYEQELRNSTCYHCSIRISSGSQCSCSRSQAKDKVSIDAEARHHISSGAEENTRIISVDRSPIRGIQMYPTLIEV